MSLRTELIRVAKENPNLRKDILPLVRTAANTDLQWGLSSLKATNDLLEKTLRSLRQTEEWFEEAPDAKLELNQLERDLVSSLEKLKKLYWRRSENS